MANEPKKIVMSLPRGYDLELEFRDLEGGGGKNDQSVAKDSKWGVNDDGNIYSDCGCGGGNCAC